MPVAEPIKIEEYKAVIGAFTELHKELRELGKKNFDSRLSNLKIEIINRVLSDIRILLRGELGHKYLILLNKLDPPQYGDAILILSQYEGALKAFKENYSGHSGPRTQWYSKISKN